MSYILQYIVKAKCIFIPIFPIVRTMRSSSFIVFLLSPKVIFRSSHFILRGFRNGVHSFRIHKVYRIAGAVGIRADGEVFLCYGIHGGPAGNPEGKVAAGAEVVVVCPRLSHDIGCCKIHARDSASPPWSPS